MKAVLDHPTVKSKLAINLYRTSRGTITTRQAAARVQAYINTLGAAADSNSEDTQ
jgi:hypothetical protein